MFTIQQTSYYFDLNQYLFCAHSITPLIFEVTASSADDWTSDIEFYVEINNKIFTPILLADITDGNNSLSKNYILYLDKIVKYYMDDFLDFEQILESDTTVTNVLKVFSIKGEIKNKTTLATLSDTYSSIVNFLHGANQFGENEYMAISTDITQYIYPNQGFETPKYNYDTYHAVSGLPFYIYYLISDELSPYYDFYIGGTFENKYALNHDETEIFTDHNGNYFII